jgi:hypothetical protein
MDDGGTLLRSGKVAKRYNVTVRTIDRWQKNPALNFPEYIEINGQRYWYEGRLNEWDRQRPAGAGTIRPPKAQKASSEMEAA